MEETISLREIFEILKKHLASIIVCMFLGLGVAGIATFFVITPQYSSQAQMAVSIPVSKNNNVSDLNTNLQMINTYKDIIVGDSVMDQSRERLKVEYGIKMTTRLIEDSIAVEQSQNSLMFSIKATNENAVTAERIANTVAEVFRESAKEVFPNQIDKISIVSKAKAASAPVSPNNKLNLAIGLVLGLMIGVGLAFLMELLDRTVKDDKFVTETLGFTILGTVPEMSQKELEATVNKADLSEKSTSLLGNMKKNNKEKTDNTRRARSRV